MLEQKINSKIVLLIIIFAIIFAGVLYYYFLFDNKINQEEKDAKKAALQTLAQEERQALKQQELENAETKDIEIIIPIGITIIKSSGNLTGESLSANLSDIQKDTYISAWLNEDNVIEFVKIKGTN